MADDREKGRGGSGAVILCVLAVLFLLPVLYVLSCGPAVALMTRGYLSEEAFDVTYAPLRVAVQASPKWIGQPLEWYADLWAAPPPPVQVPPASVATPNPTPAPPTSRPAASSQPTP